ncbi:MAG: SpoIID/LytB domain-containing protein [Acidobacteria bacterium]|nr:SpoIID/LytB domain-containing protein [Acidobacteriota bacterium]
MISARSVVAAFAVSLTMATLAQADTDDRFQRLAKRAGQGDPLVRIGLEDGESLEIEAAGAFRILDPDSGKDVWHASYDEEIRVVADGAPAGGVERVFRIQVGAFGSAEAARGELERLRTATGAPGVVHHDPDRGNWRVRLGESPTRTGLNALLERLREMGLQALWIAEEAAELVEDVTLRLVDSRWQSRSTGRQRLAVIPGKRGRIRVNGTSYRGIVELRVTAFGTVRAINWIELERYLLGVVPAELGPEVWPQLEALKAQAVAARTYVWRNKGQFLDEGFDLCATPRCQVYAGADAEHPLSDRAVRETAGQILAWDDRPIIALYTATCGGHTEDGKGVFPEHDEPYLKGVPCRAEEAAMASLRATIAGRSIPKLEDATGKDVTRDWALLAAAGVVSVRPPERLSGSQLREWTRALARLAGLEPAEGLVPEIATLGDAAEMLLADLGWSERAELLIDTPDLPALLRDAEVDPLPEPQRRALAYLASVERLQPFADGKLGAGQVPDGARFLPALAHMGETYRAFGLREATVAGMGANSLRLFQRKNEIRLPFADKPMLFARTSGVPVAVSRLEIWPGDRVRFRTDAAGKIDFLQIDPPVKGASDDRSAAVYSWSVRKTRRQLEATVNRRISVGKIEDIRVVRRGVSGRIVELVVVGSQATETVRGFSIRNILDLREILAVIEIQRDAEGEIEAVVFAGKGWGHGVGLCQVGAYGMAVRGSGYREILTHYYRGAELTKLSSTGP